MASTLPCMRPQDPIFDHETRIEVDGLAYDCRVEFLVAPDDAVAVEQVDVWCGSQKHGRWQDSRRVEKRRVHEALHEKANEIDLRDTVLCEVEDRRREMARDRAELEIDNADSRGHAHRERIAERMER